MFEGIKGLGFIFGLHYDWLFSFQAGLKMLEDQFRLPEGSSNKGKSILDIDILNFAGGNMDLFRDKLSQSFFGHTVLFPSGDKKTRIALNFRRNITNGIIIIYV